jgi:hypothetical protein
MKSENPRRRKAKTKIAVQRPRRQIEALEHLVLELCQ